MNETQDKLYQFHLHQKKHDGTEEVTGVYDYAIVEDIIAKESLFIIGGIPYIYRNGVYTADISGAMLTTMIQNHIYKIFRKSSTHRRIFEMFLKTECLQEVFEGLNQYPVQWVPFQNGMFDPITETMTEHSPQFKAINQLPVCYDPAAKPSGEITERWLSSIVPKPDDREMFLQYFGLCMNRDTRQQKFLILLGEGGSGKSTPLHLAETIIGDSNLNNIALDQLTQRFSAFGLLGKLVNICADLKITALDDTSIIKKLTGEDRLFAESKGKDGFPFRSYSKLLFSTNELPIVKDERTNGFYRRLLVLTFPKPPKYPDPELLDKLINEKNYFVRLCMQALHRMYQQGYITESAASKQAVKRLRMDSDTVEAFLSERVTLAPDARSERSRLFNIYTAYCQSEERRQLSRNAFFRALRSKGFSETKSHGERCFGGILLQKPSENCPRNAENCPADCVTEEDEQLPFE